ncbi:MAG: pantoate--beta-alanine ligase [Thermodesulfobacteriota bacterium]|nr:pantoate--beta-alanine ligase [Thermodesulfobacteriota bacterium]
MKIINSISGMRKLVIEWKQKGLSVVLVPTMGFFHEGHLSLMRAAGSKADHVVVSLFVNPAQFGPNEDLNHYPRNLEQDAKCAEDEGVRCLFCPDAKNIYPPGFQTWIQVEGLSQGLCGASRPEHFRGVATIVAKLLIVVQPDMAIFGQKDFQQLQVIRRMVRDLNIPVNIIAHPIVREPDGLAMSSRNTYLDAQERESALSLVQALRLAEKMVAQGSRSGPKIIQAVRNSIQSFSNTKIDYIFLGDPESLKPCREIVGETLLALAVWVGKTRLIDNTLLKQ